MSKKILMILGIIVLAVGVVSVNDGFAAYTNAVKAGLSITNQVTVSGANFSTETTNVSTNVLLIKGGVMAADTADITGASGGISYSNTARLTNLGNFDSCAFRIAVRTNYTNGVQGHGPWQWSIYTNLGAGWGQLGSSDTGTNTTVGYIWLDKNAVAQIKFLVTVSNACGSGYEEWGLAAYPTNTAENTTNYEGDNNNWYGGPDGHGLGDVFANAITWYGTGGAGILDNLWSVSVSSPTINLTKTISSIVVNNAGGWTPSGGVVPGATVTYVIKVSNESGGAANNITIQDVLDTGKVEYVPGSASISYTGGASGFGTNTSGSPTDTIQATNSQTGALGVGECVRLQYSVTIK